MKTILMVLVLATSFAASAAPKTAVVSAKTEITATPADGKTEFEALGRPSMVKIKGHGEGPDTKLTLDGKNLSGELVFKMETLDTGIGMRNEHMKDKYLEVQKYPTSTLKLKDVVLPEGFSVANPELKDFPFKGKLTLHGVEKDVEGKVNVAKDLKATADFEIKISDFAIAIPSYLGITVADSVKIHVTIDAFKTGAQP